MEENKNLERAKKLDALCRKYGYSDFGHYPSVESLAKDPAAMDDIEKGLNKEINYRKSQGDAVKENFEERTTKYMFPEDSKEKWEESVYEDKAAKKLAEQAKPIKTPEPENLPVGKTKPFVPHMDMRIPTYGVRRDLDGKEIGKLKIKD